ncbi:hypothetical protein E3N88_05009 [Mikania micrantha]|uniref:Uncharacterized protein n=1 Tax=Mikania micrantha TaxID=192012 RepID=A0A5N6PY33_9ASTR|nr:hypothetical protein E3N88_05009 [Mikania micrantha]
MHILFFRNEIVLGVQHFVDSLQESFLVHIYNCFTYQIKQLFDVQIVCILKHIQKQFLSHTPYHLVVGYHQIWRKRGRRSKVEEERAGQGWGYLATIVGDYVSGEEDDKNPDSSKPS